jgi:hypothetical protein
MTIENEEFNALRAGPYRTAKDKLVLKLRRTGISI